MSTRNRAQRRQLRRAFLGGVASARARAEREESLPAYRAERQAKRRTARASRRANRG